MVRNLAADENDPAGPRKRLDTVLDVRNWSVPGGGITVRQRILREAPGAPDWWYGDEDASQSFMMEMGAG